MRGGRSRHVLGHYRRLRAEQCAADKSCYTGRQNDRMIGSSMAMTLTSGKESRGRRRHRVQQVDEVEH